jgi:hypothetical protein
MAEMEERRVKPRKEAIEVTLMDTIRHSWSLTQG